MTIIILKNDIKVIVKLLHGAMSRRQVALSSPEPLAEAVRKHNKEKGTRGKMCL